MHIHTHSKKTHCFDLSTYIHNIAKDFLCLLTSSSTSLSELACVLQDGGSSGLLPGDTLRPSVRVMSDTSALRLEGSG